MNRRLRKKIHILVSNTSVTILLLFLIGLVAFPGCESRKTIVNDIDEREANEIVVFLASKNIPAYKIAAKESTAGSGPKIPLYDIAVDPPNAIRAMALLSAEGLPRPPSESLLNIFPAGGLVPSEMQQQIRYQAGLAAQIASTIRKIDGVVDADVLLSFPKQNPLDPNAPKQPVTASVYVKHTASFDNPNRHLITKIKRLVASSVPGLSVDNVTVIPDMARFSEANIPVNKINPETEYVQVWGVILARPSLFHFQVLFFSFCMAILILFLTTLWLSWKIIPLLRKRGGILQLFKLAPLADLPPEEAPKPAEEKKEGQEVKKEEPKVQENIET